jgi:hypothetical protein
MLSETAQKWKQTGLIENLCDYSANELSLFYEDVVNYIFKKPNRFEDIDAFIFPIIRRIYCLIDKPGEFCLIVNFKKLIFLIKKQWLKFNANLDKSKFMTNIDYEADFVAKFVEEFLKYLKENGKY